MTTVTTIALALISAAAVLNVARIVRPGSSLADRALGLDLLVVAIVSGTAVFAARTGSAVYLNLALITSLLGFVSMVAIARLIEYRARP